MTPRWFSAGAEEQAAAAAGDARARRGGAAVAAGIVGHAEIGRAAAGTGAPGPVTQPDHLLERFAHFRIASGRRRSAAAGTHDPPEQPFVLADALHMFTAIRASGSPSPFPKLRRFIPI